MKLNVHALLLVVALTTRFAFPQEVQTPAGEFIKASKLLWMEIEATAHYFPGASSLAQSEIATSRPWYRGRLYALVATTQVDPNDRVPTHRISFSKWPQTLYDLAQVMESPKTSWYPTQYPADYGYTLHVAYVRALTVTYYFLNALKIVHCPQNFCTDQQLVDRINTIHGLAQKCIQLMYSLRTIPDYKAFWSSPYFSTGNWETFMGIFFHCGERGQVAFADLPATDSGRYFAPYLRAQQRKALLASLGVQQQSGPQTTANPNAGDETSTPQGRSVAPPPKPMPPQPPEREQPKVAPPPQPLSPGRPQQETPRVPPPPTPPTLPKPRQETPQVPPTPTPPTLPKPRQEAPQVPPPPTPLTPAKPAEEIPAPKPMTPASPGNLDQSPNIPPNNTAELDPRTRKLAIRLQYLMEEPEVLSDRNFQRAVYNFWRKLVPSGIPVTPRAPSSEPDQRTKPDVERRRDLVASWER